MRVSHLQKALSGLVCITLLFPAVSAVAQDLDKLGERALDAAAVLDEVMGTPESTIPASLLRSSRCVAVIPRVVKVGLIFGGRHGRGLLSCRVGTGWSRPTYVAITGGSFGLQIGAQATDFVLVFTNERAAQALTSQKITLGGDASVAAGPVGRTAAAATDATFSTEIYSYSRSKGLFAGTVARGLIPRYRSARRTDAAYRGRRRAADNAAVRRVAAMVPARSRSVSCARCSVTTPRALLRRRRSTPRSWRFD